MIERLNDLQAMLGGWKSRAYPEVWRTPEAEAIKTREEMRELDEAIETGNRELIVSEATDVVITTMLLMWVLGANPEQEIIKKLDVIYQKYNPNLLEELFKGDINYEQAIEVCKQRWNGK